MPNRIRTLILHPAFRSSLFLAIGAALLLVSNGRWIFPLAAWLAPVFLLHVLHAQKRFAGVILVWLVYILITLIAWWGLIPTPGIVLYLLTAGGIGLLYFLPFLADWLLARRLPGFVATLVFPLATVTLEYVFSLASPFGTWGSLAYTQMGFLPLIQLVSVTGIWGLSFLITWFASVANWAWERNFEWRTIRRVVIVYGGIMAAVVAFGGIRMAALASLAKTIRVASITRPHGIDAQLASVNSLDASLAILADDVPTLLDQTRQAARNGAQVVFWSEGATAFRKEAEAGVVEEARTLARQEHIYLGIEMESFPSDFPARLIENKIVWIDPSGNTLTEYYKANPLPGESIVRGSGPIPFWDSADVRMGTAICYDMDFPAYARTAGQNRVGLMLVPAGDWKEIDPLHSHMAAMRAVENGFSLVRATGQGLSLSVDGLGRTYASLDYFTAGDEVMTADLPARSLPTVYSVIGDLFAWICAAGLLAIIGKAVIGRESVQGAHS